MTFPLLHQDLPPLSGIAARTHFVDRDYSTATSASPRSSRSGKDGTSHFWLKCLMWGTKCIAPDRAIRYRLATPPAIGSAIVCSWTYRRRLRTPDGMA